MCFASVDIILWTFGSICFELINKNKSNLKLNLFFFLLSSDDYVNQYASSVPKKTDEQSALNRILHETAA